MVCSTPTLPATVVMPTRSAHREAVMIAMASSIPGSQSRMIRGRCGVVMAGYLMATGATGEPTPPTKGSGVAARKNS